MQNCLCSCGCDCVGTIIAFNLYQTGCSIVGSMVGGVLSSVEPVASVIISAFLLHTSFAAQDFAGFALILITIPIMTMGDYQGSSDTRQIILEKQP